MCCLASRQQSEARADDEVFVVISCYFRDSVYVARLANGWGHRHVRSLSTIFKHILTAKLDLRTLNILTQTGNLVFQKAREQCVCQYEIFHAASYCLLLLVPSLVVCCFCCWFCFFHAMYVMSITVVEVSGLSTEQAVHFSTTTRFSTKSLIGRWSTHLPWQTKNRQLMHKVKSKLHFDRVTQHVFIWILTPSSDPKNACFHGLWCVYILWFSFSCLAEIAPGMSFLSQE